MRYLSSSTKHNLVRTTNRGRRRYARGSGRCRRARRPGTQLLVCPIYHGPLRHAAFFPLFLARSARRSTWRPCPCQRTYGRTYGRTRQPVSSRVTPFAVLLPRSCHSLFCVTIYKTCIYTPNTHTKRPQRTHNSTETPRTSPKSTSLPLPRLMRPSAPINRLPFGTWPE
jgi:hypothetical protein